MAAAAPAGTPKPATAPPGAVFVLELRPQLERRRQCREEHSEGGERVIFKGRGASNDPGVWLDHITTVKFN